LKTTRLPFLFLLLLVSTLTFAQNATVRGIILDQQNTPIAGVSVTYLDQGTQTNFDGYYLLEIPSNQNVTITFSHLSQKNVQITVNLSKNEDYEFNPQMSTTVEQIPTVIITGRENKQVQGVTSISPSVIRRIPGANAGRYQV